MDKVIRFLFLICLLTAPLRALILEAPNLEGFKQELMRCDGHAFVLFDVDRTLLVPKDRLLHPCRRNYWIWDQYGPLTIYNKTIVPPGKYPPNYFDSIIFSTSEYELVNPELLPIIRSLQERKIKAIAFTKMCIGSYGVVPSMEDWRFDQLQQKQIDFREAFPQFEEILLNKWKLNSSTPVFKKGILYASKQEKGSVLLAFLDQIRWKPSKIVFIDDSLSYLKSVERALKRTGIPFVGFHYTEVADHPRIADEKIAFFQMMYLAKTGTWLSDQAALEQMQAEAESQANDLLYVR